MLRSTVDELKKSQQPSFTHHRTRNVTRLDGQIGSTSRANLDSSFTQDLRPNRYQRKAFEKTSQPDNFFDPRLIPRTYWFGEVIIFLSFRFISQVYSCDSFLFGNRRFRELINIWKVVIDLNESSNTWPDWNQLLIVSWLYVLIAKNSLNEWKDVSHCISRM